MYFTAENYSIDYIYHNFCLILSVRSWQTFWNASSLGHFEHSYITLCVDMFSFLWDNHLVVELLGLTLNFCLTLWETAKLFFKVNVLFCIPTSKVWLLWFSKSSQILGVFKIINLGLFRSVYWCFIVVLTFLLKYSWFTILV